jgi:hypothetical protein
VVPNTVTATASSSTSRLEVVLEETRQLMRDGRFDVGRGDVLGVAGVSRLERVHVRLLARALEPDGQSGVEPLAAFLELVEQRRIAEPGPGHRPFAVLEDCVIRCEPAYRADEEERSGRFDLVLYGDGSPVVVEAKVDALEGFRQRDRYAKRGGVATTYVYLTAAASQPRDGWIGLTWGDVRACLVRFGGRGDAVLDQWLATLQREFGRGGRPMPPVSEESLDLYLRYTTEVTKLGELQKQIIDQQRTAFLDLEEEVRRVAAELGAEVQRGRGWPSSPGYYIRRSEWPDDMRVVLAWALREKGVVPWLGVSSVRKLKHQVSERWETRPPQYPAFRYVTEAGRSWLTDPRGEFTETVLGALRADWGELSGMVEDALNGR